MTVTGSSSPKILYPSDDAISTAEGDSCRINCTARTTYPEFHLVYWLVNGAFVEDMYPDGRVKEEDDGVNETSASCDVTKVLVFTSTHTEDFTRTFTCVVQDPSGVDTKNITLTPRVKETTTQKPKGNKKHHKKRRSNKGSKKAAKSRKRQE
ncbi:interleukin-18-binding protein [Mantella aurantiaca]